MANVPRRAPRGTENHPLVVDDDDDDGVDSAATRAQQLEKEAQEGLMLVELVQARTSARASGDRAPRNSQFGDAGDAGDEFSADIEDALAGDIAQIIDLTDDGDHFAQNSRRRAPRQEQNLSTYMLGNGIRLRPEMTVELKDGWGPDRIRFIRIRAIVQAPGTLEVLIRGWGYVRVRELDGRLPRKVNEVAMVARLTSSSQIPWQEQSLIEVSANAIGRKRTLKITNAPYPKHRYDKGAYSRNGKEWVEEWGPLVCRFRYELFFNDGCDKPCESAIVRIGEDEADPNYRVPDEQNQNGWRGGNVPGGSYRPNGPSLPVVDVESNQPRDVRAANLVPGQRYTAGDVFAGAGGASRGIERAGVQLLFAVDHWCHAAESLRSNFNGTNIHEMEVTDVILRKDIRYNPDILHLSPPCQFWSPAHTIAGQNDDQNIAVLFSCTDLIAKFRPRLFTVEQTFGILHPKFQGFFNRFLQGFTEHGYSVRWKILPLVNYGVPQLRKRLIMIGAAPGEKLPPLPAPTHNKDGTGGLQPWVTPKSALAPLVRVQPIGLHRPARRFDHRKPRWDPDRLAKTITTSGGQNYHWDGERDFTLLEYAVLQGFPIWHKFEGSYVKKQIGNAFAPSVVKLLYEHLVGWLLEQDGFDPSIRTNAPPPPRDNLNLHNDNNDEIICLGSHNPRFRPRMAMNPPGVSPRSTASPFSSSSDSTLAASDDNDEVIFLGPNNPFSQPRRRTNLTRGGDENDNGRPSFTSNDDEIIRRGFRHQCRRNREWRGRLGNAVLGEHGDYGEAMEMDVDDLSDTSTVGNSDDDVAQMHHDGVIDLTEAESGTVDNPCVI